METKYNQKCNLLEQHTSHLYIYIYIKRKSVSIYMGFSVLIHMGYVAEK